MLDVALEALGPARLLWGCDLTMETGLAKLRALEAIGLEKDQMSLIRWGNAVRIFPRGAFPGIDAGSQQRPERGVAPAARRPPPAARR